MSGPRSAARALEQEARQRSGPALVGLRCADHDVVRDLDGVLLDPCPPSGEVEIAHAQRRDLTPAQSGVREDVEQRGVLRHQLHEQLDLLHGAVGARFGDLSRQHHASTVSRESDQSRADDCASSNVLPTGLPSSTGNKGRNARTAAMDGRSVALKTATSRSFQKPPGSNATVSPPTPLRASSSTIRPAHRLADGRDAVKALFADEVRDGVGQGGDRTSPVNGRVLPNPGRSTAITSRLSASSSSIGTRIAPQHPVRARVTADCRSLVSHDSKSLRDTDSLRT